MSAAEDPRLEPGAEVQPPSGGWALLRRAFLPVSLVALLAAGASVPLPYFLERPGPARPLAGVSARDPLVEVPSEDREGGDLSGSYLLMVVNQLRATPFNLLYDLVDDRSIRVPAQAVLPPGVAPEAYFDAQRREFATTAEIAAAVGLRLAGLEVPLGEGVRVVEVAQGSPADGSLQPDDVVVLADGSAVATTSALQAAVAQSGTEALPLTVRRGDDDVEVVVTPAAVEGGDPRIGVSVETVPFDEALPVDVAVDGGRVGGPSGGLMIALSVYDLVDGADLAAGREIAGTGTIDADGSIGPIGGIELKVLAAHGVGADVFLAPEGQGEAARGALPGGSDLQILEVATADEAVEALSEVAASSG